VRGTRTVAATVAVIAVTTTAVALAVVTEQTARVELGPAGIEIETLPVDEVETLPSPTTDPVSPEAGEADAGATESATDVDPTSAAPDPEPTVDSTPGPIETVVPEPAKPAPAGTGRPESPGNSNEHNPNK